MAYMGTDPLLERRPMLSIAIKAVQAHAHASHAVEASLAIFSNAVAVRKENVGRVKLDSRRSPFVSKERSALTELKRWLLNSKYWSDANRPKQIHACCLTVDWNRKGQTCCVGDRKDQPRGRSRERLDGLTRGIGPCT